MRPRVAFVVFLGVLAATIGAAEALDTSAKAPRSSAQPVTAPRDCAWLIGASSAFGAHPELRLTNTDGVAALVEIVMFGPSGVVTARNATGLAVAAHSTRVIPLETLAPAQELLLVNVRARS